MSAPATRPLLRRGGALLIALLIVGAVLLGVALASPSITKTTNLAVSQPVQGSPSWKPDGLKLAYSAPGAAGLPQLFTTNADGTGTPTQLTTITTGGGAINPTYSPSGTEIAFDAPDAQGREQVFTINSDGSGTPTQVTSAANGVWT